MSTENMEKFGKISLYDCDNPRFKFFTKQGAFPNNLTIGFENEIVYFPEADYNDKCRRKIDKMVEKYMLRNPYLYLKEECSNNGVELNSHPFNWNWFTDLEGRKGKQFFVNEIANLRNPASFYVDSNCGFHIHLAKKFFTHQHLVKMVKFFYKPKNGKFLRSISKRTKGNFDAWSSNRVKSDKNGRRYTYEQIVSFNPNKFMEVFDDKSAILNLYPKKTIEIRMFQGTTNPKLFHAYLEFAMAVTLFTRNVRHDDISVVNFKKFVKKNISDYSNLYRLVTNPNSMKAGAQK